jgi:hypothetical protein
MSAPTSDEKGKAMATMNGKEYTMSSRTLPKGTFLDSISSASSRRWFTKKMKKKKRNATTKEKKNSLKRYQ